MQKKQAPKKTAKSKNAGRRSVKERIEKATTEAEAAYKAYRASLDAPVAVPSGFVPSTENGHSLKSPALMEAILNYLRKGYVPKHAAEAIGISRTTAFKWRSDDPDFAKQWEEAVDEGTDLLEAAVLKRARDGVARPVFQQGDCVGFVQEYSDSLAALLLSGRRPMYRKQQPDDSSNSGVTININGGLPGVIVTSDPLAKKDEPSSS